LPTLARIAMVFDVGLEFFFTSKRDKRPFAVLRQEERMRFPERPDAPQPAYFFECLSFMAQNKSFEVYIAEFPVREVKNSTTHQHPGSEFVYVMAGSLAIGVGDEEYLLNEGDSAYFDSSEPHRYLAASRLPSRALVVTAPPHL
jgi:quercetin dioxygenase-like cupin family protein